MSALNEPKQRPIGRAHWWSLAVVYVTLVVIAIGNVLYTQHVDSDSNRKWCVLMTNLDNAYKASPPTTPAGIRIARDVEQLLKDLDC